jgi:large subunit ribosomal protein L6
MSRIGNKLIPLPTGVQVVKEGSQVTVTGPKGTLQRDLPAEISLQEENGVIQVTRPSDESRVKALHGLTRALLANMIIGVTDGFRKEMEIIGVGYRAQMSGDKLIMQLGYSHPIEVDPAPGIAFEMMGNNRVAVSGIDKEKVGQAAAELRAWRPPEPYKGKGLRYVGEVVARKAGKGAARGGR